MQHNEVDSPAHISHADQRQADAAEALDILVHAQRRRLTEFPEFAGDSISAMALSASVTRTFPTHGSVTDALAVAIMRLAVAEGNADESLPD